nr:EAL domain-containing protein [uncultured Marinobacter sp.]
MRWLPRPGFRGRLIIAMISLVAVVSLVIGALLMVYLFEDEESRALTQLNIGERIAREVMERRTDLELSRLSVVVQDFGFLSALASRDAATIGSALANHSRRVGADFAVLLDNDGEPIASTLSRTLPGITPERLATARRAGFSRFLISTAARGFEVLIIPVEAPGLRAWLVTGFALDEALANLMARLSGTSVFFRARPGPTEAYRLLESTVELKGSLAQDLGQASANPDMFDSARYFSQAINLGADTSPSIQAVMLLSREASLQNYYERAMEIALLVSAILVLAILLALVIARNLGRPVLELADYARAVGEGETPAPPAIRTGGELGQLRDALRDMLTSLREREAQIRYTASHDEVTGLGNRNALMEAAHSLFEAGTGGTLIGIRLNDLSDINDTLGLEFGDKVLTAISWRLHRALPDAWLVARTGGGEFLALLPARSPDILDTEAQALHDRIEEPLLVDDTPFALRVTMVTLQLPSDAANPNELRRRLNLTFEQARQHSETVSHYQPGQDESHLRELKLIGDLHTALANNGLHMHYQPKLDVRTGQLAQVEALVRWNHPELGNIVPDEFIFLAEQSGQIHELTAYILQCVANDARAWSEVGVDAGVAINLSAKDLTWPALTDRIAAIFGNWHQGLERITLEVTESALMDDPEVALATLNRLRGLGVTLAIDDFGTGYSSLSQLRTLPVQELKIDKSFVLRLDSEPHDQLIVQSTIDMAHGLGLQVVAEGIESLEAWQLLQRWGCDLGQGFFISRPVPAADLPATARALAERHGELARSTSEYLQ